jgi:hypothetical protein
LVDGCPAANTGRDDFGLGGAASTANFCHLATERQRHDILVSEEVILLQDVAAPPFRRLTLFTAGHFEQAGRVPWLMAG